jgi:ketosteroid isomerase-like protein
MLTGGRTGNRLPALLGTCFDLQPVRGTSAALDEPTNGCERGSCSSSRETRLPGVTLSSPCIGVKGRVRQFFFASKQNAEAKVGARRKVPLWTRTGALHGKQHLWRDTAWAMSEENVEVVRAQIDAYNRRDYDAALALLDEEVVWHVPEVAALDAPTSGIVQGRARVAEQFARWLEAFARWLEAWETHAFQVTDALSQGDDVFIAGLQLGRGRHSGLDIRGSDFPRVHRPRPEDRRHAGIPRASRGPRSRRAVGVGVFWRVRPGSLCHCVRQKRRSEIFRVRFRRRTRRSRCDRLAALVTRGTR